MKDTEKSQFRGVIFDMDGVIFDSEAIWQRAAVIANEKFRSGLTEADRQGYCGMDELSIRKKIKAEKPDLDADAYRDFIIDYVMNVINTEGAPLKDGFLSLSEYLKTRGCKIALATSAHKKRALSQFAKKGLDISALFDGAVFSEDVVVSKPNPEIFLKAAKKIDLNPEECIVIEDSLNGIEAATRGGFMPVMVIDLIPPSEKAKKDCLFIADSLNEVKNFLIKSFRML